MVQYLADRSDFELDFNTVVMNGSPQLCGKSAAVFGASESYLLLWGRDNKRKKPLLKLDILK